MPALVKVAGSDGDVLFEGEFSEAGLEEIGIRDRVDDVVATAQASAATVARTVSSTARSLLTTFEDLAATRGSGGSLSQAVVELGVSVTGEGNVFVVKGSAEANLKVTLTWDFA